MIIVAIAGAVTGILTGFGVGGGTLLMIYMTNFAAVEQTVAQGINLLYFIPTSAGSLYSHIKNGFIDKKAVIPAAVCGSVTTALCSYVATGMDMGLLKKLFGAFLILTGVSELFRKDKQENKSQKSK